MLSKNAHYGAVFFLSLKNEFYFYKLIYWISSDSFKFKSNFDVLRMILFETYDNEELKLEGSVFTLIVRKDYLNATLSLVYL